MGQPLVIEIYSDKTLLASAYYHWSEYTQSALELAKNILRFLNNNSENNQQLKAIKAFEYVGSGLVEQSLTLAKKKFQNVPFKEVINRNYGLIAITEEDINNNINNASGLMEIDLNTNTANFQSFWFYNNKQEIIEANDWMEKEELEELKENLKKTSLTRLDFSKLTEKQAEKLYQFCLKNQHEWGLRNKEGNYFEFIKY